LAVPRLKVLSLSQLAAGLDERAGTARLLPDNVDEGERLLRRANALASPFGTTKTLARCLSALASARLFAGDLPQARSLHDRAIGMYRELGEVSAPPT